MPASWSEIARHDAFVPAARALASNMLDLCDRDERLCAVFKDAGRYIAAMSAAFLHGSGGLTLPLLKQICAASGLLSAGRASAILEFLMHIDYLRPPADKAAGGQYLPTARFLAAWCRHLQVALEAAALIDPALAPLAAQLDDPETFAAFLNIQAARLYALSRQPDPLPGIRRAFLHPHAGSQILWTIVLTGTDGSFPASDEIRLSLSDLSGRFGVTHLHVRRLFKQADAEGILAYQGHGRLTLHPAGIDLIRYHYAFQLCELVEGGREMLARLA